jgi:hypothetical protein
MTIITRIMNWFRRTFIMGKRPPLIMSPEAEARLIEAYGKPSPDKLTVATHSDHASG